MNSLTRGSGNIHTSSSRHEYPNPKPRQTKSYSPEDFHFARENSQEFWAQLSSSDDRIDPLQDWN
jgi:hypothetical protein